MKVFEIWYVVASQQKKMLQFYFLRFQPFLAFFGQKHQKLTKYEENWQNPNRLMKFSQIFYVDGSKQNKMLQKSIFRFQLFLAFFRPKTAKIDQK